MMLAVSAYWSLKEQYLSQHLAPHSHLKSASLVVVMLRRNFGSCALSIFCGDRSPEYWRHLAGATFAAARARARKGLTGPSAAERLTEYSAARALKTARRRQSKAVIGSLKGSSPNHSVRPEHGAGGASTGGGLLAA
jgi:hypothetical protein